jgi:hypothetical protein
MTSLSSIDVRPTDLALSREARSKSSQRSLAFVARWVERVSGRSLSESAGGRPDVPPWVFCSQVGTPLDERNVTRSWYRVRRRAQKDGVRPLKLHAARHTYATLALESGRSIRFVAERLGHANPALTLRVYVHAMPAEPGDVAFADFPSVTKRHYASPTDKAAPESTNAPDASGRGHSGIMEHETRFELAFPSPVFDRLILAAR